MPNGIFDVVKHLRGKCWLQKKKTTFMPFITEGFKNLWLRSTAKIVTLKRFCITHVLSNDKNQHFRKHFISERYPFRHRRNSPHNSMPCNWSEPAFVTFRSKMTSKMRRASIEAIERMVKDVSATEAEATRDRRLSLTMMNCIWARNTDNETLEEVQGEVTGRTRRSKCYCIILQLSHNYQKEG